jgi:preprotein translocase subunit SecG
MRRLVVVTTAIVLAMLLQTVASFASGIQVVDTHPAAGGASVSPTNFAIRVNFDQDVSGGYYIPENQYHFIVTDSENNVQPARVLFDPSNPERVLVVLLEDLAPDTEFTLTISGDFSNRAGNVLGDDYILRFHTRDMARDMNTSMILMIGFLVILMVVSTIRSRRQAQKDLEEKEKNSRVNPYKVSKKTGKTVSEIVEKDTKNKRKKAAEEAKRKEEEYYDDEDENDYDDGYWDYNENYRVAERRPISAYSTYKSGKKARAEAVAKKKAATGTTKPKNQTGKSKNKKKK